MNGCQATVKQHHNSSNSSSNSSTCGTGTGVNNTHKPTNDLVQVEKIRRIVQREILDNGRHLFPRGRWPSDGVADPRGHPEPYTAAMKYGGRDPNSKKRPGLTKRPPNMWMIFRMHAASVVMEDFPEVNQAALTSVLAPIWQSVITPAEKDLVREESERLKELHKLQFPEWKYKPRQKKRVSQQQQQQASEGAQTKGSQKQAKQQNQQQHQHPQHQQQNQHYQHQQHQLLMQQEAVSPYLSSGSPDIDHIDGLQLPLSVDTSPQHPGAAAAAGPAATAGSAADCLPFTSPTPWAPSAHMPGQPQQQQLHHPHHQHAVSTTMHSSVTSPPTTTILQHPTSAAEEPKDPTLRSILAASAPSSASSLSGGCSGGGGISSGEFSCLPELLPEYFNDLVLPDLEAYLCPTGCSGGPVSDPPPLPTPPTSQQQHQLQQLPPFDFPDPMELRHSVKQEFRYAVI